MRCRCSTSSRGCSRCGRRASLRADLELLYGNALLWQGRCEEAARRFESASRDIRDSDPRRATQLLCGAAFGQAMAGDVPRAVASATTAARLAENADAVALASANVTLAWALILAGEAKRGYPLLMRCSTEAPSRLPGVGTGLHLGQLAYWVEDFETARHELERRITSARADGCPSDLPPALSVAAEFAFRRGEWVAARRLADEGFQLAADTGQEFAWARVPLAQLDAATGDAAGAHEHADAILALASRSGNQSLEIYASAALGLLELGRDAPGLAAKHLEHAQAVAERCGLVEPNAIQWQADLIESQVRAGRAADASRSLDAFERLANATGRRWAHAAAARCRALLAPATGIDEAFAEAHRLVAAEPSPFERARTELCWGERLRRAHRRVEARRHLEEALTRFEALGAAPWAEKAARELRSSGTHARRGPQNATRTLTAAESQIAALVAEGMTNKDIAAALFLSPKTIEFHLGHIYRKLDIHSRTQLARALLLDARVAPPAAAH